MDDTVGKAMILMTISAKMPSLGMPKLSRRARPKAANRKKAVAKEQSQAMNRVVVVADAAEDAAVVGVAVTKSAVKNGRPIAAKAVRKNHANQEKNASRVNHVAAADPAGRAAHGARTRAAAHRRTISMMTVSRKLSSTIRRMRPSIVGWATKTATISWKMANEPLRLVTRASLPGTKQSA